MTTRLLPVALGIVGTAVVAAGSHIPSFWWDEAATVSMADRSPPEMLRVLANVDAVHGLYYFFIHAWFEMFGISEFTARVPSALAVGIGTAALVRLTQVLAGSRAAVCAGVVFVVLPRTTWSGAEARSYAMVAALAAVSTLVLVLCLRSDRRMVWWAYVIITALSVSLFLYAAVLILAHALTVLLWDRRKSLIHLVSAAGAVAAISPLVVLMVRQSSQVSWVPPLDAHIFRTLLVDQFALENPLFAGVLGVVVVTASIVIVVRRSYRFGAPAMVVLPWLFVPMASMLAYSAAVENIYIDRYLIFCTPAAAVATGALVAQATSSHRGWVAVGGAAVFLAPLVLSSVPSYLTQRTEWDKSGGMDYSSVADYVDGVAETGDCVAFQAAVSWAPSSLRTVKDARPDAFVGLDDVGLGSAAEEADRLWDVDAPVAETVDRASRCEVVWVVADADRAVEERRLHSANVVWVFEPSVFRSSELSVALVKSGFREDGRATFDHSQVVRMIAGDQTQ